MKEKGATYHKTITLTAKFTERQQVVTVDSELYFLAEFSFKKMKLLGNR